MIGMVCVAMTGCGVLSESRRQYPNFSEDGQYGRFEMAGDAAGMREAATMFAGMIREGKAPDNAATTPYWNHRMDQERTETIRKVAATNKETPDVIKLFKDFLFPKQPSASNGTNPMLPADQIQQEQTTK